MACYAVIVGSQKRPALCNTDIGGVPLSIATETGCVNAVVQGNQLVATCVNNGRTTVVVYNICNERTLGAKISSTSY